VPPAPGAGSASGKASPLLSAVNLSLTRGGRELFSKLSLQVAAGEICQIEGSNGAGKTSLLRILAGLSRLGFAGQVDRSCELLFLGHASAVKGLLTPRENLNLHPSAMGQYCNEQIERALAEVGLYGYEDVASHALSAGQHRRVNLARLYLTEAPLWILDEPFTAIDRDGVLNLERRFESHAASGGAVIVTSHSALSIERPITRVVLDPVVA
jgi:heme exporter protein A